MAAYETLQDLKNHINDEIYNNNAELITGVRLQEVLHDVVDTIDSVGTSGGDSSHTHDNKTVLDQIVDAGSGYIITSSERNNIHTHPNKAVLDQISHAGGGKILPSTQYNNLTHANAQLANLHTDGDPSFNNLTLTGTLDVAGNVTLNNIVQGDNYSSGILGKDWRIDPTLAGGCLIETDNVRIRGELRSHIFKHDIVRSTSAYLYVSDSTEIADNVTTPGSTGSSFTITVKDNVFVSGNRIKFRDKDLTSSSLTIREVTMDVTSSGSSRTLNGKTVYDFTVDLVSGTGVTLNAGDTVVRTSGATILMDAASANAPFMELRDGLGNLRSRYGNLNGSYQYTSNLYGLAAGPPTGDHITIDSSNGVRFIDSGGTVRAQFTGGSLSIVTGSGISNFSDAGSLATQDSADWSTQVDGTGKPADNADVTSSNPQASSWLTDNADIVFGGDSITRLIGRVLDNIADGSTYARVRATDISDGHILLSEASGSLDDISNGTYGKVLATDISSGHIRLSETVGNLDDIDNGTYGKVLAADISSGHIILSAASGTLDDISEGTTYGKVKKTQITAGEIVLVSNSNYIKLDAANSRFSIKNESFGSDGIQMEYNSGNPRFHVGNSSNYIKFDPSASLTKFQIRADSFKLTDSDDVGSYVRIGRRENTSPFGAMMGNYISPPDPHSQFPTTTYAAGVFIYDGDWSNQARIGIYAEGLNVSTGGDAWAGYFNGKVEVAGDTIATDFVLRS